MNIKLLGLLAAASLATAACQQDKKVETTTTTTPEATTTTTTTTVDTVALHDDARRTAARVAEDLKLTDPAVATRIERTYYTRGRLLNDINTRYAADTTGRYAAIRQANDVADEQIRTELNNPTYYNTYSANRANYGDGPYSLAPTTVTTSTTTTTTHTGSVGQGSGIKKVDNEKDGDHKTKFENGAKVKHHDDGSVKIKRADGTKVKIDENGNRTVKKGLFK
ncbi:AsnC family protein [Hymenobacter rubidus]|uniref:AsnC family protein n=1 Tax=Hymenobacter rubidus TaxID=1441626 RepID=UPI00191D4E90|nr:AsnC family protein [Hymenobacter rubidus]